MAKKYKRGALDVVCRKMWGEYKEEYSIEDNVKGSIFPHTIKRPPKPSSYRGIANYFKSERFFPYYTDEFIKEMESKFGTDEYIKFVKEEYKRILNGFFFYNGNKLEYITGAHYFFLQYWKLEATDEKTGRKTIARPRFRDSNRDVFYAVDHVMKDSNALGLIWFGARRSSKTAIMLSSGYIDTATHVGQQMSIQSKADADARKMFAKLITSWKKLPIWLKPRDTGATDVKKILEFSNPKSKQEVEAREYKEVLNSFIDWVGAGEATLDGVFRSIIICDEIGKTDKQIDIYDRHQINRYCVMDNAQIVGKIFAITTVEDMNKYGSAGAVKLWNDSDYSKRDNETGRTKSGLLQLFLPASYGYSGSINGESFMDEHGYSLQDKAEKRIRNERKQYTGSDKQNIARKFPLVIEDATQNTNLHKNAYNTQNLYKQRIFNSVQKKHKTLYTTGELVWENGLGSKVVFHPQSGGKFRLAIHPAEQDKNAYTKQNGHLQPTRTFFRIGVDPFDHEGVERGSKGAAVVWMKDYWKESTKPFSPVAMYNHRQNDPYEFYEDMAKLAMYYSAMVLVENNKPGVINWFKANGMQGYIMFDPLENDPQARSRLIRNNKRGINMTSIKNRSALMSFTQSYISDRVGLLDDGSMGYVPFDAILADWANFDTRNWTPHDIAVAAGIGILAWQEPIIDSGLSKFDASDWGF
jgi:hypothetical protein